jgi:hypothetical protein
MNKFLTNMDMIVCRIALANASESGNVNNIKTILLSTIQHNPDCIDELCLLVKHCYPEHQDLLNKILILQ